MAVESLQECFQKMYVSGENVDLTCLMKVYRQHTCQQNKCLCCMDISDKELLSLLPAECIDSLSLDSLLEYFDVFIHDEGGSKHVACTVEILRILYKDIMKHVDVHLDYRNDNLRHNLLAFSEKCLQLPDTLAPVPLECESDEKYNDIINRNIALTLAAFRFYLDIICSGRNIEEDFSDINEKSYRLKCLEELSNSQRYIIKKTASKAFTLACIRLGDHQWTNSSLRKYSDYIVCGIRIASGYESITDLLSGVHAAGFKVLFTNGLFVSILSVLTPHLCKNQWTKNMPSIHALIWCLMKVKYPHLSEHIARVTPPLLLLSDHYLLDHKQLGIKCLQHLIANVNPADLRLYNHADVIYHALFQQLYSNKHEVYQVALPCLLQILMVLEGKPGTVNTIKYTRWDTCFEKLMQDFDMATNVKTELVLLNFFPQFIDKMEANVIKHLDKVVNLVGSCLHFGGKNGGEKMLLLLHVLSSSIKVCWPVIDRYGRKLVKIAIKILIDMSADSSLYDDVTKRNIEEEVCNVLKLIKLSCSSDVDQSLRAVMKMEMNKQFSYIHCIIKRVLEMDPDVLTI